MSYIKELHIRNFRGIRDLELSNLGVVNVIVGENNAGKTSVLEAIAIIERPTELGNIIRVGGLREILNNKSSYYTIFKNMLNADSNSINISANIEGQEFNIDINGDRVHMLTEETYSKEIERFEGKIIVNYGEKKIVENVTISQKDKEFILDNKLQTVSMEYVTSIEHLTNNIPNEVIKKGKKKELVDLLKIFDKNIVGLEMLEENGKTIPYLQHKKFGLMPLSTYGEGTKKVLLLGSSIIKAENGVLLIDEVETAIHIDALVDIFKWFIKACKRHKVQVFMTTHSIEVIDSLLESQNDVDRLEVLRDLIRIITIRNSLDEKKTKVRNIDGLKAYELREDFNMELR